MSHNPDKILLCLSLIKLDRSMGPQLFFGDNFLNQDIGNGRINSGIDRLLVLLLLKMPELQLFLLFFQSLAFVPAEKSAADRPYTPDLPNSDPASQRNRNQRQTQTANS